MTVLLIIIAVVVIIFLYAIYLGNNLIRKKNKIDEARSGIEVALTKRYDMLTKLLDVAKAYASHEKELFAQTIRMRKGMSLEEMEKADTSMSQITQGLRAVAESYPELHSDTTFKELQAGIRDAEDQLQAARRVYNSNVTSYNTALQVFPSNIIANFRKLAKESLYEAEEIKKNDVKMTF